MLTIGELIESMAKELFINPIDDFEKKCAKRETDIKNYLEHIRIMIMEHVDYTPLNNKLSHFQKERINKNVKNLCDYTELLCKELDKDRIQNHIKHLGGLRTQEFEPDYLFLIFNSLHGSIISDIVWAGDLSIFDAIKVSRNDMSPDDFELYIPNKIYNLRKNIGDSKIEFFSKIHLKSISEVFICYENRLLNAANVLLLTTIEGLVRELAGVICNYQKIEVNLDSEKYNSLSNLLRKIPWVNDIPIDKSQLSILNQDRVPRVINWGYPLQWDEDFINGNSTEINLNERLGFLKRRFKEHRDNILHGDNIEYGNSFHLYTNLSALSEVLKVAEYYHEKIKNG